MRFFMIIVLGFLFFSCNKEIKKDVGINGLWTVKKVKVGQDEMTPVAKWMRFNSDSTQTSGNGWLQHSVGTWSLNSKNKLSVTSTYGVADTAAPFLVELEKAKMIWSRKEDGQNVQVFLERIDKIPASKGNKLMGLWSLNSIGSDNKGEDLILQHSQTLFLRWDNTFVKQRGGNPKEYGIYKIHGHKPEIQMVNYGEKSEFKFYNFSLNANQLILKSTNKKEELKLTRIHQFPQ